MQRQGNRQSLASNSASQHFCTPAKAHTKALCSVSDDLCHAPCNAWQRFPIGITRLRICGMRGVRCTEIQRRATPVIMSGLDAVIQSETGSGKTLAFLVPTLAALQYPPDVYLEDMQGPQVHTAT